MNTTIENLLDAIANAESITIYVNVTNTNFCATYNDLTATDVIYVPDRHWLTIVDDRYDLVIPVPAEITVKVTQDIDDAPVSLYKLAFADIVTTISIR